MCKRRKISYTAAKYTKLTLLICTTPFFFSSIYMTTQKAYIIGTCDFGVFFVLRGYTQKLKISNTIIFNRPEVLANDVIKKASSVIRSLVMVFL